MITDIHCGTFYRVGCKWLKTPACSYSSYKNAACKKTAIVVVPMVTTNTQNRILSIMAAASLHSSISDSSLSWLRTVCAIVCTSVKNCGGKPLLLVSPETDPRPPCLLKTLGRTFFHRCAPGLLCGSSWLLVSLPFSSNDCCEDLSPVSKPESKELLKLTHDQSSQGMLGSSLQVWNHCAKFHSF